MTWRELIGRQLKDQGETWNDVIAIAPPDLDIDRQFDDGFGLVEGDHFTLWTPLRVYFPAQYDGNEWCASVPRNPCAEITYHVGDGG